MTLPTVAAIEAARRRIAGHALRTPLVRFQADAPAEIWLKLENLQPIGSFKIRGAASAMAKLGAGELRRGVLTASAGNMAQGVAWMARALGVSATIIAPDTAPRAKLDAIERLGGRVVLAPFERWWRCFEERSYPGVEGVFVHAFDDPAVIEGNATIAAEVLEELTDVTAFVVPWGGGGLACGIAAGARALGAGCRVHAAEIETAAPLAASLAAGRAQVVDYRPSFVDGIASKTVFPRMLELAQSLLAGSLVTSLAEVADAIRLLATRNHVVAEGAGAVPVAAARAGGAGSGKVVCVVSGGNIDAAKLATILSGGMP